MQIALMIIVGLFCYGQIHMVCAADGDDDVPARGRKRPKSLTQSIDASLKMVSTKKIQYEKPRIVATFVFPRLLSDEDDDENDEAKVIERHNLHQRSSHAAEDGLDGETESEAQGLQTTDVFNHYVSDIMQSSLDEFKQLVANKQKVACIDGKRSANTLHMDYDASIIKAKNNRIISLRFTIHGRAPDLHGVYRAHKVLNYNIDTHEKIELVDIFKSDSAYLRRLASYCNQQLRSRVQSKTLLDQGTAPTAEHYKNWNIKGNGLLITFDESQAAPAALGSQTVLIPFHSLEDILSSSAPLGDCVKNNKRCRRNNVVTGGFIDEASKKARTSLQLASANR